MADEKNPAPEEKTPQADPNKARAQAEVKQAESEKPSNVVPTTDGKKAPENLQASLDKIADDVKGNKPSDGTVTLDFGKAGKLTGCLIMSNSSASVGGEQTVGVPFEAGYVFIHGVPATAVK